MTTTNSLSRLLLSGLTASVMASSSATIAYAQAPQAHTQQSKLTLMQDARIAFIGGGLGSRMDHYNHFETELHLRHPKHNLYIRNFCREGDTPGFRPSGSRKSNFAYPGAEQFLPSELRNPTEGAGHLSSPDELLKHHQIDTIVAFFGYSESFRGQQGLELFKKELTGFIQHTKKQRYNGKTPPKIAIVSPIAFEDHSSLRDLPNGEKENSNLQLYTKAIQQICANEGVVFADAFTITNELYAASTPMLTAHGHDLTDSGYALLAPQLANKLFGKSTPNKQHLKQVHAAVAQKNHFWKSDYKIPNGVHVHGRRYKPFGPQNYPYELKKIQQMTAIRDQSIWAATNGQAFDIAAADAKTIKLPPVKSNKPKISDSYLPGNKLDQFTLPKGYKIDLFASEKEFPDLANPVQLSFDNKGRLWVAVMPSYPHHRIGDPAPQDKLLILEDTNNDGKADKQTTFAADLHLPIGFEIAPEGVYVSQGNDLVLLTDTDGDDKYDKKKLIFSGFDDHDTHHAISAFCADPSGAIYMGEGTFLHSNVETPYGPVRGSNGGFYRYSPQHGKLERTSQCKIPNPWGIAFDDWGQNFFIKSSGPPLCWMPRVSTKPRYGINPDSPNILTDHNVRPTAGLEFISSRHFPDEVQGDILLCNVIGFLGAKQHKISEDGTGFIAKHRHDLFKSDNPRFRPSDLEFAPDGSLYVLDWSNALIGHMQHNQRDPKRDHDHGRIYRVTYPSRPLVKPAKVHDATIPELLDNLKLHEARTRYRTRRELRGRQHDQVIKAISSWVNKLDPKDPNYEHHLLEALYVKWGLNKVDGSILNKLAQSSDHKARAAAIRVARYSQHSLPNATQLIEQAATDPHGRVRLEAIVAASWMEKSTGEPILDIASKQPKDPYLTDALLYAKAHINDKNAEPKHLDPPTPKHLRRSSSEIVSLFKKGYHIYNEGENCASCHGAKGEGLPAANFPPLAKSAWVSGSKERLIKIALNGLQGDITVNGKEYKNGIMPGFGARMDDKQLSAVLTYVRNTFGNTTRDMVTAQEVATIRKQLNGRPNMMKVKDLLRDHPDTPDKTKKKPKKKAKK